MSRIPGYGVDCLYIDPSLHFSYLVILFNMGSISMDWLVWIELGVIICLCLYISYVQHRQDLDHRKIMEKLHGDFRNDDDGR
jgi:low affinity Fe/Cu permease